MDRPPIYLRFMPGVILRHKYLAIAVQSNVWGLGNLEDGVLISYLPLAHIYEVSSPSTITRGSKFIYFRSQRAVELCLMALGGRIGYFTGDPLRLLEDTQVLKPNFFPSVPRVLNKIYQSAMVAGNAPGLKGAIFKRAVKTKLDQLRSTGNNTHHLWDRLVFRKVRCYF
jgi:long-chain acyl-CoA synthetase